MMKQSLSLLCEAKKAFKNHNMGESGAPITPPVHREGKEGVSDRVIEAYRQRSREEQSHLHREEEKKIKESRERCEQKMKDRVVGVEKERERSVRADNEKRLPGGEVIQGTGSQPNSITT